MQRVGKAPCGTKTWKRCLPVWCFVVCASTGFVLPSEAGTAPDFIQMHPFSKVAIPVLANDDGIWDVATLAVDTAPTTGVATVLANGHIRYEHTSGLPLVDVFTYRVADNVGVTTSPETVAISFSAQARLSAPTVAMPTEPPVERYHVEDAFPGLTFSAPVSMESPPDDTNRLFVVERRGTIQVITNVNAIGPKIQFLDISTLVTNDSSELGMKGIAFHPGYETNGYFYVTYCHTSGTVRLSRFTRSSGDPNVADPNSELVLIDEENNGRIHNIDDPLFGPDGYLYLGFGDEGFDSDSVTNTQTITKDIWSAIIRIDPDKRPGNLEPNPHPAIPTDTNGYACFSIPSDNPFIGATQFNGEVVNPDAVRTEFYAVGFRNPWQFSFDSLTNQLWVGDVGHQSWEAVYIVPSGGNAGWAFREGSHPGPRPAPPGFSSLPPVWEYPHDIGPFAGSAVIGGLVVHNADQYPDLDGKYLCADLIFGHIWSIDYSSGTAVVERIAGEGTIVQFGLDPANGNILMVDYDEGLIRRLVVNDEVPPFPEKLSDTGFFADLVDLAPNPGVAPYGVNLPFWSDYAVKQRWFVVTNLVDGFGYNRDEAWGSVPGMMWVKHFDIDLDRGNTNTRHRIETRVLVRTTNGVYGVSYRWNNAGTEAYLSPDMGDIVDLPVTNGGNPAVQRWSIPSRSECVVCHNASAGYVLGLNTRQLNHTGTLFSATGNYIDLLAAAGYFTNAVEDAHLLPRHVRPDENAYSLEVRARSYLAVNCGYCHRGVGSPVPAAWDGRAQVPLAECGLIRTPASDNGGDTNNLLIVPGDEFHSIIWDRIAVANGFTRMPPLASSMLDYDGIQLVANWITQQLPNWQTYEDWRLAHFGAPDSPEGDPAADPDADTHSNWEEFLTYSNPTNGTSFWSGNIALGSNGVEVDYSLFNRSVIVEISPDLLTWTPWAVAGNNGLPLSTGQTVRLPVSPSDAKSFYRFRIEAH